MFASFLLGQCAGFPERAWLIETRRLPARQIQPRTKTIVDRFDEVAPKNRALAIEAVSAERSPKGRDSLLDLYERPEVQNDSGLKEKIIQELKERPEIDTPQKFLDRIQAKPALFDSTALQYIDDKLGKLAAGDLLRIVQKEPALLTTNLVDYFQKHGYQPAHSFLLESFANRPELITPVAVEYFLKHKETEAPEKFLQAVRKQPQLLGLEQIPKLFLFYNYRRAAPILLETATKHPEQINASLLHFFGKMRYTKAAFLIKKEINKYRFIKPGIQALADMKNEDLNLYIIALGRDKNPELRLAALESIAAMESTRARRRARPDMQNILRFHTKEPKKVVWAGLEFFRRDRYKPRSFELLKIVYKKNPDNKTKEKALAAMSAMRGISQAAMRKAMLRGIGKADAHLALDRYKKQRKTKTKPQKTALPKKKLPKNRLCRMKHKYAKNYAMRLRKKFRRRFGKELGYSLRTRLHHALQSFADGRSDVSALVFRAYRNYLELSKEEVQAALRKGLEYPGSLSAVVWRVHAEYANDSMRSYALASIFGIERWKATELLSLVREKCL